MKTNIILPIKNYLIRCGLPMLRTLCDELRPTRHRIHIGLSVLVGALILLYIVAVNGYVTFFSDSGSYLYAGLHHILFFPDRQTSYGWFAVYSALKTTLFLTVFWQALLTSLCIFYVLWYCTPSITNRIRKVRLTIIFFFMAIILCSFTTGVSVFVSQIMPDIFTSLVLLIFIVFYFQKTPIVLRDKLFCIILFVFSISTHNSHLPTFLLLVSILFLCCIIRYRFQVRTIIHSVITKKLFKITLLILFPLLFLSTLRFIRHHDFVSSGGESFLVARLLETNIIHDFLHKNCAHYPYKLCPYQDSLQHSSGWFLWNVENSPFYKFGNFDGYKDDAKKMLRDIFSEPQYVWAFCKEMPKWTWTQIVHFELGDNLAWTHYVQQILDEYFHTDFIKVAQCSKKANGTLNVSLLSQVQAIAIPLALSLFLILWASVRIIDKKSPPPPYIFWIFLTVLLGLFCNAFVCATFSGIFPRYQARMIWVVWLPSILFLLNRQLQKYASVNE